MDSLSQAALGATVGIAVMGRSRPVWQAALAGAVVGTLPDLDVLLDKGNPVRDMVLHRAETHAYLYQFLATPLIAAGLAALGGGRALFWRWTAMVLLVLWTHTLLDSVTVYGTRVALPFSDQPVGLGSLFIIDPLYTLPLLVGIVLALASRRAFPHRWAVAGLLLSTTYVGWSVAAQAVVKAQVMASPAAQGLDPAEVLVTPTPFNTVLWRIVLRHDDHYAEGFYSLADRIVDPQRPIRYMRHPRGAALEPLARQSEDARHVMAFSKGFYALSERDGRVYVTDLRMGQHPFYAFSFAFAERRDGEATLITPQRETRRLPLAEGTAWLWARMAGNDTPPPA